MMKKTVEIGLFGVFRDCQPEPSLTLEVPMDGRVADVRQALVEYGRRHWPRFNEPLLRRSVFASETTVLCDRDALPQGPLAILPPVAGG